MLVVLAMLAVSSVGRADDAKPDKGWDRSVALGVTVTSGNTDSTMFNGGVQAQRAWEKDEWRLGAEGAYGKVEGDLSVAKARGYEQYKRVFKERWYGTVVGEVLHDALADLAYRISIGPGLGYYFIKSDLTKLSAEVGPSLVAEKYEGEGMETYCALRLGERFERKLSDSAKVWQSLEVLPQVNDWQNFTALAEIGAEAALNKTLSIRLVAQDRYNNQPAAGKKSNDFALIGSLVYKF
jgi:putative salt-induced outer membrane protein YdiY